MPAVSVIVRPARPQDLRAISQYAGELVRLHHRFDEKRFMLIPNVESGYEWFFGRELSDPKVVILAADQDGEIVGYAYGRLEERDWNSLLDDFGAVHDIFVSPAVRGQGVGRQLMTAMLDALGERGAPRVVLHTATQNEDAQRLFKALGFRPTMIEMTREQK
jgi:ribosomal protein S18 acetylase RimI-like enzyme